MGQAESTEYGNQSMQSVQSTTYPASHAYSTGDVEESMTSIPDVFHSATQPRRTHSATVAEHANLGPEEPTIGSTALAELLMLRQQMKADKEDFEKKIRGLENKATLGPGEGSVDNEAAPPSVVTGQRWVSVLADAVCKQSRDIDVTEEQLYHQLMGVLRDVIFECPPNS